MAPSLVSDPRGTPALGLFLWEDGAEWDWLMNYNMNDPFPRPPDPTIRHALLGNRSSIENIMKNVYTPFRAASEGGSR